MKPLDLKIEWLRSRGFSVDQRDGWLCIHALVFDRKGRVTTRALMLPGNPTYRRIREGLRTHFNRSGAGAEGAFR